MQITTVVLNDNYCPMSKPSDRWVMCIVFLVQRTLRIIYIIMWLFYYTWLIRVMVFNTTFNNISAVSWWTVLLVKETGVPVENHWPSTNHKLYHNVVSSTPRHQQDLIDTDCICSFKSNYHAITTALKPTKNMVLNCQEHLQCKINIPGRMKYLAVRRSLSVVMAAGVVVDRMMSSPVLAGHSVLQLCK